MKITACRDIATGCYLITSIQFTQSGASATGHSMFNNLPLVSSDFCAILYIEAVSILACVVQRRVVE